MQSLSSALPGSRPGPTPRHHDDHHLRQHRVRVGPDRRPVSAPGRRGRPAGVPRGWKEVTDPSTGNAYYWNTETNVTTWEKPAELTEAEDDAESQASNDVAESPERSAGSRSFASILKHLEETAEGDPNSFGAVANIYRPDGVFTNDFMDFVESELKNCDAKRAELIQKVQARIVNPLLKQGEFY